VELDVLARGELPVAAAELVRDLADRAQLRRRQVPTRQLDPEHERPDLRLVVVETPPLKPHHVLLRDALVAGCDQCRELVTNPERRLLLLEALDRVALEHEVPRRLRLRGTVRSRLNCHSFRRSGVRADA
jgi:hypothetical protein